MRYAYHGGTTLYANLVEDIRLAGELGYDSIEPWTPKVLRYLDAGFTADDLAAELDGLGVPMLDVIVGVERQDPHQVEQRLAECARLAEVANRLGCPAIQIVATDELGDSSWPALRAALVDSISALADVAAPNGIRLAIEPLVYVQQDRAGPRDHRRNRCRPRRTVSGHLASVDIRRRLGCGRPA